MSVKGFLPFLQGDYSIASYVWTFTQIFNKQMTADLNLESPYAYVRDGTWTIDTFREYIKAAAADVNGDGKMNKEDSYGYLAMNAYPHQVYPYASGIVTVKKDENDYPVIVTNSERYVNTIVKYIDIIWKDGSTFTFDYVEGDKFPIAWDEDRALIQLITMDDLRYFRNYDSDYGIIPLPKYDEAQDAYHTITNANACIYMLPADTPDPERTGIILEALTVESYKSVIPVYYDTVLSTKYTRDEESVAMLDLIFGGRVFDFGAFFYTDCTGTAAVNLIMAKDTGVASYFEKKMAAAEEKFDGIYQAYLSNVSR